MQRGFCSFGRFTFLRNKHMNFLPVEQALDCGLSIRGLRTETRDLPLVVFLHGNGFSSGVYLPMHNLLAQHVDMLMLDIPGHGKSDRAMPFAGWNKTAAMLHQAIQKTGLTQNRTVYGVGHSLGGIFTLLTARANPSAYRSLVLLDPILFPRAMLFGLKVVSRLGLTSIVHPHVRPTLKRRKHWSDKQEAFNYFHGRKIYRDWTDAAVQSYVDYALKDSPDGGLTLCCDPETESAFFASLPVGVWDALKFLPQHVSILKGDTTYPFSLKAAMTAQSLNSNIQCKVVDGSHCFMQEDPESAATEVLSAIGIKAVF